MQSPDDPQMPEARQSHKPTKTIFISHSSSDKEFVEALTDLLKASFRLPAKQILCTSVAGHKLAGGADTEEELLETLHDAKVLIGLLTPASLSSSYVLFELGARWGLKKPLISLVGCGARTGEIKEPLKSKNALDASDENDLHQLVEDIADILGEKTEPVSAYSEYVKRVAKAARTVRNAEPLTVSKSGKSTKENPPIKWGKLVHEMTLSVVGSVGGASVLNSLARRQKLSPYREFPVDKNRTTITCSGLSLTEWNEWWDEQKSKDVSGEDRCKYEFAISAELVGITAPLIEAWRKRMKLRGMLLQLTLIFEATIERRQHIVTANLFGTGISVQSPGAFEIDGSTFFLKGDDRYYTQMPRFYILSVGNLAEIPWQKFFGTLIAKKILLLDQKFEKELRKAAEQAARS